MKPFTFPLYHVEARHPVAGWQTMAVAWSQDMAEADYQYCIDNCGDNQVSLKKIATDDKGNLMQRTYEIIKSNY